MKETIYFLEWLEENYNIDPELFLNNCRPENRLLTGNEFFENYITRYKGWVSNAFWWEKSCCVFDKNCSQKHNIFSEIDSKWLEITTLENTNFEFSRYPIKDYRLQKPEINDLKLIFN